MASDFPTIFRHRCDTHGRMSFAEFMRIALYHPTVGYYAADRKRVGRDAKADFYTASQSELFGELVSVACTGLCAEVSPSALTFVEIGAEPEGGIFAGKQSPFREVRNCRLGNELKLEGPCVVFSNELFDAQPFHRLVFKKSEWVELGVEIDGDGALRECELPELSGPVTQRRGVLPKVAEEGYRLDLPIAATDLAAKIAAQSWTGLFLAFDYGKTWHELAEESPNGSVRAYSQHAQTNDLLARPGEQDLTGHICWDWLAITLAAHGFKDPVVEPQEAFLVRHAGKRIAEITVEDASRFSTRKQSLLQLLHPSHMGQKFQALWAKR